MGSAGSWTDGGAGDGDFVCRKLGIRGRFLVDRGVGRVEGGCRGTVISQNSVSSCRNWIVFGSVGSWGVGERVSAITLVLGGSIGSPLPPSEVLAMFSLEITGGTVEIV